MNHFRLVQEHTDRMKRRDLYYISEVLSYFRHFRAKGYTAVQAYRAARGLHWNHMSGGNPPAILLGARRLA